jgi:cytochrome b subunit of formate dehydrogenase
LNSPFSGRNIDSILLFSVISGIAFSWLVFDVVRPMLTTPWTLGLPYLVNLFFQLLITGLILFAIFHNGLDLVYKAANGVVKRVEGPKVKRFDLNQRIQHIWLFTSTAILAVTGFAQLYYEAWGRVLINAMGGLAINMDVHLLAATFLGVLVVYHFAFYSAQYLAKRARGEPAPLPIMIGKSDITQALQNVKHMLGRAKEAPKYGKYDYGQKFDYWGRPRGHLVGVWVHRPRRSPLHLPYRRGVARRALSPGIPLLPDTLESKRVSDEHNIFDRNAFGGGDAGPTPARTRKARGGG